MEKIIKNYRITDPRRIRVKHCLPSDIIGMYDLFSQEGCNKSENKFSNEQEGVYLDGIQERIARLYKTDKQASADFLICVNDNKIIMAEAKFRAKKVENLELSSLKLKFEGSRALIYDLGGFSIENKLFVVYLKKLLTPSKANKLSVLLGKRPRCQFVTAEQFYELFE